MDDYALYGYSVFETFLAKRGCFWRLDCHWRRLCASAHALGLAPPSWARFVEKVAAVHDADQVETIRCTLLKQGGRWSAKPDGTETRVFAKPCAPSVERGVRLGVHAQGLPCDDPMRAHKCGARLAYQHGFELARRQGVDDCLFFDRQDRLLETSVSNVFALVDGEWRTPAVSLGLLPGIARAWALERGMAREAVLHVQDLAQCAALAVTNSTHGVMPVVAIDGRALPAEPVEAWRAQLGPRAYRPL